MALAMPRTQRTFLLRRLRLRAGLRRGLGACFVVAMLLVALLVMGFGLGSRRHHRHGDGGREQYG
jgi:hypothetical protein